jgi:hypothetical protein
MNELNFNFSDLYKKIQSIDEGSHQADTTMKHVKNPTQGEKDAAHDIKPGIAGYRDRFDMLKSAEKDGRLKDESMGDVEECGDMPMMGGSIASHGQSDSVTMNVSMNGSGAGGIRDLMSILKDLDNVGDPMGDHGEVDVVFGNAEPGMEEEAFGNSMPADEGPETFGIDAVTATGNDMNSKGGNEVEKVNGGGNPYSQVDEVLTAKLHELYNSIKNR